MKVQKTSVILIFTIRFFSANFWTVVAAALKCEAETFIAGQTRPRPGPRRSVVGGSGVGVSDQFLTTNFTQMIFFYCWQRKNETDKMFRYRLISNSGPYQFQKQAQDS